LVLMVGGSILAWVLLGRQRDRGSAGVTQPRLQVRVWRGKQEYPLVDAVPLHTGDQLQVNAEVPDNRQPALFWFDTEGRLHPLTLKLVRAGSQVFFCYPAQKKSVELAGPPGTEVLLLCARLSRPVALDEIEDLFSARRCWPELPSSSLLHLDQNEVRLRGDRAPGRLMDRPESGIVAVAERLRDALRDRFDFVGVGVAFPHQK
jgi:hypothetical protein